MTSGIPFGTLQRVPSVDFAPPLEPYLVEVIVPFSTGTVTEAVAVIRGDPNLSPDRNTLAEMSDALDAQDETLRREIRARSRRAAIIYG